MATGDGYIKLNRKILEWEWYDDINTFKVFIHCLLRANFKDQDWHGKTIKQGSFVSSYANLSNEIGISVQSVRTSIKKLKLTGELTIEKSNKYSVFIVNNYCRYQDSNKQDNTQSTSNQQATNKQLTTIEERKEGEEVKNINKYLCSIPLKDGTEFDIEEVYYDQLLAAYPNVDLNQEFKKILVWCKSNPYKLKTRQGVKRFINSWIANANNSNANSKPLKQTRETREEVLPIYTSENNPTISDEEFRSLLEDARKNGMKV